jgi:hypothetical protein
MRRDQWHQWREMASVVYCPSVVKGSEIYAELLPVVSLKTAIVIDLLRVWRWSAQTSIRVRWGIGITLSVSNTEGSLYIHVGTRIKSQDDWMTYMHTCYLDPCIIWYNEAVNMHTQIFTSTCTHHDTVDLICYKQVHLQLIYSIDTMQFPSSRLPNKRLNIKSCRIISK